ncbi:hypothetical protein [Cedecea sp. NFIX57]|uniref:hypothetical protein n=1 Tax=Cedecea sp. NFIX57 TaxID=1566286 RepID=UPI000A09B093|nr:hypothetical protein [Cedecea sp. NFIX57]SMG61781.1 hypothetical protein SAMN03159353_105912 [Cedecea sp. NFIX57]
MQDAPLRDRVTQYADALYPDMQILAPTRWGMRQARQTLLTHLNGKGFERYPDKTQVGRLSRARFDWLGWNFTPDGICPVPRSTIRRSGVQGRGIPAQKAALRMKYITIYSAVPDGK